MIIKVAIQCTDKRTGITGTFGYLAENPLYSVTPVFAGMISLIDYCNRCGIIRDYSIKEVTPC